LNASTQHQGGKKIPTFFGRIRAMLNIAGVKDQFRSGVWAECAITVTFLSNVTSIKNKEVDVETVFLHGELQEEIYMNIPEGMSYNSKHCLLSTKTIYGLVQSAREFYKKLMATLKSIGFKGNKSDPCLLLKWTQVGVIMIGIYVDDCLVIGKRDKIDELIVDLRTSGFSLKVENNLTDYLSC
jgi:hypothetical protein